jgi:superfamily I DNA/RNA helicase
MSASKHLIHSPKSIASIFPEAKSLERKFEWAKPLQIYAKSFRNVKGLEFDHVFVTCLDLLDVPMDDETLVARTRKRVYTMMMRARDYLTLTCTGNLPAMVQPIENYVDQIQQGI